MVIPPEKVYQPTKQLAVRHDSDHDVKVREQWLARKLYRRQRITALLYKPKLWIRLSQHHPSIGWIFDSQPMDWLDKPSKHLRAAEKLSAQPASVFHEISTRHPKNISNLIHKQAGAPPAQLDYNPAP
jgi:hypothetical protein